MPTVVKSQLTTMFVCTLQSPINVASEFVHIGAKYGDSVEVRDILLHAIIVHSHVKYKFKKINKIYRALTGRLGYTEASDWDQ